MPPRRRTASSRLRAETATFNAAKRNRCRSLLVIDNAPLQAAAWSDLARARKRLEKATRDLHRHEEVDEPAFRSWLGATFPLLVNAARELSMQTEAKQRLVDAISQEAYFSGRAEAEVWQEWERYGGQPPPRSEPPSNESAADPEMPRDPADIDEDEEADPEAAFEKEMKRLFAEQGFDPDELPPDAFREFSRGLFGAQSGRSAPVSHDARATYRRLVQQLHPDRGGAWTPARARLWEQTQEAWQAGDADWLARLEAEWEAATDALSPSSALGRLRAALKEIDAARRDADRKLRVYRQALPWRFSLQPAPTGLRIRVERMLRADCEALREQLEDLTMILTNWERASRRQSRRRTRNRSLHHDPSQAEFGWGG